jgi:hypothetical protein
MAIAEFRSIEARVLAGDLTKNEVLRYSMLGLIELSFGVFEYRLSTRGAHALRRPERHEYP